MAVDKTVAHFHWQDDNTLILHCHIQPKASRDEFAGLHGDALKIRLRAPPVEGKANRALIQFLSAEFAVPKSQIALFRGQASRRKSFSIVRPRKVPPESVITMDPRVRNK